MTATRAALLELATRVEQASGPDRILDEAIMTVLFLREERFIGTEEEQEDGTWAPVADAVWVDPVSGKWVRTHAREFTASLDAALTLVPEGWRFSVDNLNRAGPIAICEPDRGAYVRSEGTTPALALCAASLRALAAEAPQ